ncbi:MAG: hypothetical protein ACRCTK_05065 [Alphaproteobacteria bacterium]
MLLLLLALLSGGSYAIYVYPQEKNFQEKTKAETGISLFPSPKGEVPNPRPIDTLHHHPSNIFDCIGFA